MAKDILGKADEQVAESIRKLTRATSAMADAIDEGTNVIKHPIKRSGDVAEELLDDTTRRVKRHPIETMRRRSHSGCRRRVPRLVGGAKVIGIRSEGDSKNIAIAASRTPPWPAAGWGCRGRPFHNREGVLGPGTARNVGAKDKKWQPQGCHMR